MSGRRIDATNFAEVSSAFYELLEARMNKSGSNREHAQHALRILGNTLPLKDPEHIKERLLNAEAFKATREYLRALERHEDYDFFDEISLPCDCLKLNSGDTSGEKFRVYEFSGGVTLYIEKRDRYHGVIRIERKGLDITRERTIPRGEENAETRLSLAYGGKTGVLLHRSRINEIGFALISRGGREM